MRTNFFLFPLVVVLTSILPGRLEAGQIWSLGVDDQTYAEFALSGDYASFLKQFPKDPVVQIGNPEAALRWPSIHPGPRDGWAGSRAHAFAITFALPSGCDAPAFELVLDTVAAHPVAPPMLKIDLNGAVREVRTRATCRSDAVLSDPGEGRSASYRAVFLARDLRSAPLVDKTLAAVAERLHELAPGNPWAARHAEKRLQMGRVFAPINTSIGVATGWSIPRVGENGRTAVVWTHRHPNDFRDPRTLFDLWNSARPNIHWKMHRFGV